MEYRTRLWPLAFLTLLSFAQAKRNFIIDVHNFTCDLILPSIGKELTCTINQYRPDPIISVRFMLRKPVNMFYIDFDLEIYKKDNTKMKIANNRLDGCKFLNSFYGNNIYGKFFKRVQKTSNLPTHCPIPSNKLFEIRNYTVLAEEFPPVTPACTYNFILKVGKDNNVVAEIYFTASVVH